MNAITVPSEKIRVAEEVDICVIGGSCTGVFAAVRAARLGARVVIVEKQNRFGGIATCGLVGMWHSLFDIQNETQIIGGLTFEVMERLKKHNAISDFTNRQDSRNCGVRFNTEELTLELDEIISEHRNIKVLFNTYFSRAVMSEAGKIDAVILENKSGRFAVRAKAFVDASGDGDLCFSAGLPMRSVPHPQPPTACARFERWNTLGNVNLKELMDKYRSEYPTLPCGYYWGTGIPGSDMFMLAGTRVFNCDCANGDDLSKAEMESRRQVRALMNMLRDKVPGADISLQALPSLIGIRESRHIESVFKLAGADLLHGKHFEDAIANGTYPVDIHGDSDDSIRFMHLSGDEAVFKGNVLVKSGRWLPEGQYTPFYQIPLRSLIPQGAQNVIAAGRMLDADAEAFGAVRVMVNLNQCGEAAGVAAWQYLNGMKAMTETDFTETRKLLASGGSIII